MYDAKDPDEEFPRIKDVRPPKGAPNVLVILLDDVGFGATSAFGGPCNTPNVDPNCSPAPLSRFREDATSADHYIDHDERARVMMARQ